jgi:hypothetical protein
MTTFHENWQWRIAGKQTSPNTSNTTQAMVERAIASVIPKSVSFTYNSELPLYYAEWAGQMWPWSAMNWGIVVIDKDDVTPSGANYGGGSAGHWLTVARWPWEDGSGGIGDALGNRIWHELLHSMDVNSDALNWAYYPSECARFCTWVMKDIRFKNMNDIVAYNTYRTNDYLTSIVTYAYYTMLWEENGFNNGTNSVANVRITTVNNYVQNIPMPDVRVEISSRGAVIAQVLTRNGTTAIAKVPVGHAEVEIPCGVPISVKTTTPTGVVKTWNPTSTVGCNCECLWNIPVG